MISDEKWYVRNTAGKVFGPIDFETLKAWVRDGRVEPLAGVSKDLQNWMLAPLKPELEMDWIIENNPGQFYGPTHRSVVDDFLKSGTLSPGARFYHDDHGQDLNVLRAELESAKVELESTKSELKSTKVEQESTKSELVSAKTEQESIKVELESTKSELESAKSELESTKSELESTKAELEKLKAERDTVHAREWKTEVLVPEVVVSDEPPPSVARTAFGANNSSLAALERQAQAELARMGANSAKSFFAFGRKKG